MMKRAIGLTGFILIMLTANACLRTRAELRADDAAENNNNNTSSRQQQSEAAEPKTSYAVDELRSEITRLSGRLEELERQRQADKSNANSKDSPEARIKHIEDRIIEIENAQMATLDAIKKLQSDMPPKDPVAVYETAKSQYLAGHMEEASKNFSIYLAHPAGNYAEEALFLRGESYFALKNYKKAIADYSVFPEKYTHSKHMPQALYKIGLSMENINMGGEAKAFYQELVEKYPKSNEAKLIKSKLSPGKSNKNAKASHKKKTEED